MKKILYYNWVRFDDDENRGGGVTVYQRNLIEQISNEQAVFFICSGLDYDLVNKNIYYEEYENRLKKKCRCFRIVNSPMIAPAHLSFFDVERYLKDDSLYFLFEKFIAQYGPFDVIHFNNLEGLSLSVLKIKERYPETKIIYSLHNYYPFCPQVNLWSHEKNSCVDNNQGVSCLSCLNKASSKGEMLKLYKLKRLLNKKNGIINKLMLRLFHIGLQGVKKLYKIWRNVHKIKNVTMDSAKDKELSSLVHAYADYSKKNVAYINKYVDVIVAVSDRVRKIAIEKGIDPTKICTRYIGTKFADKQLAVPNADIYADKLNIIYMGYARRDKGFYFLISALEKLDEKVARNINLKFAVKIDEREIQDRIERLGARFNSVSLKNGYKHDELNTILSGVHLGIVPVLWEDNLPQVAIELVSCGVAVLASDKGGASELTSMEEFKFESGNEENFNLRLSRIVEDRSLLKKYWTTKMHLMTMKEHLEELKKIYE